MHRSAKGAVSVAAVGGAAFALLSAFGVAVPVDVASAVEVIAAFAGAKLFPGEIVA